MPQFVHSRVLHDSTEGLCFAKRMLEPPDTCVANVLTPHQLPCTALQCTSDTVKYDKEACEAVTQELGPYEDLLAGAEKEEDEESPSQGSVV